ncbi:MAG: ATP synthase F0 subunit C [bacterium]
MALGVAAFGGALGLGRAVGEAVAGISRQPEAATNIQGAMIIGCAFIEALTIYALVALFVLSGKITG